MIVSRPELCLAKVVLVLAASLGASAAVAFPMLKINITNGSQYPLVGMELVTLEAGSSTPSASEAILLDEPLMPGKTYRVDKTLDPAVAARGGQQQLRWYWTSDRACWNRVPATASKLANGANTGAHVCEGGRTPEPPAMLLAARMQAVDAIVARGDVVGAIFEINALMAVYPGLSMLFHRRGELHLQNGNGNPWQAEMDFRKETDVDAGHFFYDMAMVHFARGEGQRALEFLSSAVDHSPDNMQYLSDRAQLSCMAGDVEQMREDEAAIAALGGPQPAKRGPDCNPQ